MMVHGFRRWPTLVVLAALAGCAAPPTEARPAPPRRESPPAADKADRILVLKNRRQLQLLRAGVVLKSFPIALGPHPAGPKRQEGDGRTPEGVYAIDWRTDRTPYHLALHISYPGDDDRAKARDRHVPPGSAIFIHGLPARFGHTDPVRFFRDWTDGCIAVGNIAIEKIWQAVADGTPIGIRP